MVAKGFRVCEMFESIQGEGRLTGTPALFIRLHGCNLKCAFCDEPLHRGQNFESYSLEELIGEVVAKHLEFILRRGNIVVISGGEPTIYKELPMFIERLRNLGAKICVESNGWKPYRAIGADLYSFSPKDFFQKDASPIDALDVLAPHDINVDIKFLYEEKAEEYLIKNISKLAKNHLVTLGIWQIFISPINGVNEIDSKNAQKAAKFLLQNKFRCPVRLGAQTHKIYGIK